MSSRQLSLSDCLTVALIFDNGSVEHMLLPRPTLRNRLTSIYVKEMIERQGYVFVNSNNWKPTATRVVLKSKFDFLAFYDEDGIGVVGEPIDVSQLRHSDYIVFLRSARGVASPIVSENSK